MRQRHGGAEEGDDPGKREGVGEGVGEVGGGGDDPDRGRGRRGSCFLQEESSAEARGDAWDLLVFCLCVFEEEKRERERDARREVLSSL